MGEALEKALLEMLESVTKTTGQAIDFLSGEIPKLVLEILKFHAWEASIYLSFQLLIFFFGIYIAVKIHKNIGKQYWSDEFPFILLQCIPAVMSLILLPAIDNIIRLVKIIVAPRLYLIEYISELTKTLAK